MKRFILHILLLLLFCQTLAQSRKNKTQHKSSPSPQIHFASLIKNDTFCNAHNPSNSSCHSLHLTTSNLDTLSFMAQSDTYGIYFTHNSKKHYIILKDSFATQLYPNIKDSIIKQLAGTGPRALFYCSESSEIFLTLTIDQKGNIIYHRTLYCPENHSQIGTFFNQKKLQFSKINNFNTNSLITIWLTIDVYEISPMTKRDWRRKCKEMPQVKGKKVYHNKTKTGSN